MGEWIDTTIKPDLVARHEGLLIHSFLYQDYIYHYTSAVGLKGILESGKLWFTDIHYMNDADEIKAGIELFTNQARLRGASEEYLEKIKFFESDIIAFVACFSMEKDVLGLWNYYTKNANSHGYNISFDYRKLIDSIIRKNAFLDGCNITCGIVEYTGIFNKGIYSQFVENNFRINYETLFGSKECPKDFPILSFNGSDNKFAPPGAEFLFFEKRDYFEDEEEFRIVIEIPQNKINEIIENKHVYKFREANGVFVPYLDVEFDRNAIAGLTIAPTLKSDLVGRSLDDFCRYNGLDPSTFAEGIESSKIPVRF